MGLKYGLGDLFHTMIALEKCGAGFYESAALAADDLNVRETFKRLALQEKAHEKTYREMSLKIGDLPEIDGEYADYTADLIDRSFALTSKMSAKIATVSEAFEYAKRLEEDSIKFLEVLEKLPGLGSKEIFGEIKQEEIKHLKIVENLIAKYSEKF